MTFTKLSIKNFIGDIPRIFNENFETLKSFINSKYNEETNTLSDVNITTNGTVKCGTLNASNMIINMNGTEIYMNDIINQINELKTRVEYLESQINS